MTKELIFLIICSILTLTFIAIGVIFSFYKKKRLRSISLPEFMTIAICSYTIASSLNLLYRVINSQVLLSLLSFDIFFLVLGVVILLWQSIQQIWNIFK